MNYGKRGLFVTTCNKEIYDFSTVHLIKSFLKSGIEWADLAVFTEGVDDISQPTIHQHYLDNEIILKKFLIHNQGTIPIEYGGNWSIKKSVKNHFHYNASRYYRKPLSAYLASKFYETDYIIWVDADCIIKQYIPFDIIKNILKDKVMFHFKSKRQYTETGVYGINLKEDGDKFLTKQLELYSTKEYIKLRRWCDCATIDNTIKRFGKHICNDLAKKVTGRNEVIPNSVLGKYIQHKKGSHMKEGIL